MSDQPQPDQPQPDHAQVVPPPGALAIAPGAQLEISAQAVEPSSFAFVVNISALIGADRFTIAPNHILRAATDSEIEIIKTTLAIDEKGQSLFGLKFSPWEYSFDAHGVSTPLDRDAWRYFVIEFQGSNSTIVDLEKTFCLTDAELGIAFVRGVFGHGATFVGHHPGRAYRYVHRNIGDPLPLFTFSQADADQVVELTALIQNHDPKTVNVQRLLQQMLDIEELPSKSPLRFLAYFGILESLLTHQPKPSDPYDSITRQVKTKVALLDNRWTPKLAYAEFGGIEPAKLWGKMYDYRSRLAHGDPVAFDKELKELVNAETVLHLLKSTVKAVARLALREPQLVADLKNC